VEDFRKTNLLGKRLFGTQEHQHRVVTPDVVQEIIPVDARNIPLNEQKSSTN